MALGYSNSLKELIHECLYEKPSCRPTLEDMKERIQVGLAAVLSIDREPEPWENFVPYDDPILVTERQNAANAAAAAANFLDQIGAPPTPPAPPIIVPPVAVPVPVPALIHRVMRCTYIYPASHPTRANKQCRNVFRSDGIRMSCGAVGH